MRVKTVLLLLIAICSNACVSPDVDHHSHTSEPIPADKLTFILTQVLPAAGQQQGERIDHISSAFLGTPYEANTLTGSPDIPEALVINLNGVDCFTLLDYVQALSRSQDRASFNVNLLRTRYVDGELTYLKRRHFFSDWFADTPRNAYDMTRIISPDAVTVGKQLNRQANGKEYIPGLGVIPRQISYIPASAITSQVLSQIKTGDYVGIYTPAEGLDVSHVGIAIWHDDQLWYRNASSLAANRKVVDSPFMEYMQSKPGIVVLRAVPLTE